MCLSCALQSRNFPTLKNTVRVINIFTILNLARKVPIQFYRNVITLGTFFVVLLNTAFSYANANLTIIIHFKSVVNLNKWKLTVLHEIQITKYTNVRIPMCGYQCADTNWLFKTCSISSLALHWEEYNLKKLCLLDWGLEYVKPVLDHLGTIAPRTQKSYFSLDNVPSCHQRRIKYCVITFIFYLKTLFKCPPVEKDSRSI